VPRRPDSPTATPTMHAPGSGAYWPWQRRKGVLRQRARGQAIALTAMGYEQDAEAG